MPLKRAIIAAAIPLLAGCALQADHIETAAAPVGQPETVWAFEQSDIPVDPAFRFGQLGNGMRFVIRQNATPKGTAIVRMEVQAGSLDETDAERGFAHFVEHMAFNGSTNVPEGEMIRLLERQGLAFGADTNASTGFEYTTYKLDLPHSDQALLDLALMLMRETASELTFSPEAVEREKGVVLAEMRDRNTYGLRNAIDSTEFLHPGALYPRRFPIGTAETLQAATAQGLKAFWASHYVPGQTTLVIIGDIDPLLIEAQIRKHFESWQAAELPTRPDSGPVKFSDQARTDIYIDPALPERLDATRHGPWLDEHDTVASRQEGLLRQIGYSIINRRFQRIARQTDAPLRGAGFGTGDVFEAGRSTRLIVDTSDRKWRQGLIAAATEYRRAMKYGFTDSEIVEQIAIIRTHLENAAASAPSRSHHALAGSIRNLTREGTVPSEPHTALARFEGFSPMITASAVIAALKREAIPLQNPLLRFRGRYAPEGGAQAIRDAWDEASRAPISKGDHKALMEFAYSDFGKPGPVVSDVREPILGIRTIRFANGVMLNLKQTDLEKDRIRAKVSLDGGKKLNTRAAPFASELVPYLAEGGLQEHSEDDLQSILAGRVVNNEFRARQDAIVASVRTTPRDLLLQLQVLAAYLTDPGYRKEGIERHRQDVNRYFAQLNATPSSALSGTVGGILSDSDPRFSLGEISQYRKLTFDDLAHGLGDRLEKGAIEIGMVGDIDQAQAIAAVAATFGALPAREADFREYNEQPPKSFTHDRSRRIVRHSGPTDQALIRLTWPTRDDSDPQASLTLELLERIARIEMTDSLREALGKAYSPGASSALSRYWSGYGTFSLTASVAVSEIPAARAAVTSTLARLRNKQAAADLIQRARQPMIERYQNALKSNGSWLSLVGRAQSETDRIERFTKFGQRLQAVTADDLLTAASRYLDPKDALEIIVLPEGIEPPA